jgi:4-carboxymuconolactone decarboxylase
MTTSRLTTKIPDDLNEAQRAEYDDLVQWRTPQPDGSIGGPFDPWMLSPELSHRLRGLAGMLWARTTLDRGMVELAICITGKHWEANVEWAAHAPRAIEYGIASEVLDAVFEGRRPDFAPAEQVLLYDVCVTLHRERSLPEPLQAEAARVFGEQGLVELIAVIGFYTLVSMTLNAFEIPVAPGVETPFPR